MRESLSSKASQSKPAQPRAILLSAEYLNAVAAVEQLPSNQDGADKGWVCRAVEDVRRHFAKAQRI
jgi:hypothetical protein